MFLLGGEHKGNYTGVCMMYNIATQDFTECSPMLTPRVNFGAIHFRGDIYCVGGWKNAFTQACDVFSI